MTEAAVSPARNLVPGTVLGERFEIRGVLGQGAMGMVYEADDNATDRKAAIKVLHQHLTESREYVGRFKREAQVASRFRHEAAVRMLGTGDTDHGVPYIAMELVEGRSLKELIADEAPIPYGRALNLAAQILRALGAAHRQGIVHRDVKPDNIRIQMDDDGIERPKLLDFGVAKLIGGDMGEEVTGALKTKTGVVLGTPKYMSPEQIRGEAIDGRSDIYAVGAILYELITGLPPFDADDVFGFITKHLKERIRHMTEAFPDLDVPDEVDDVVLRMLAKDPTDRPADAAALADGLEPYAVEDPRAAEKGRALRRGMIAVAIGGCGAALASALLTPALGFAPPAAAAGLAVGACLAAARVPRPSVYGYVRRLGFVAVPVLLLCLVSAFLPGGHGFIAASFGLVALYCYVAFLMVWSSRMVWLRPVVAGLAAPLSALLLLAVHVEPPGAQPYFVSFLTGSGREAFEAVEKVARTDTLLAVVLLGLPFGLASTFLPRPGAARLK